MFVTLSTVAVTSVRAVNNLTTTHHAACPPALLLASAHASTCLRVSPPSLLELGTCLPCSLWLWDTCGQGTCLHWTGCGCSTDVEGPLLLWARHRCSQELLLLRDCLVSNIRSQKQAAPSQQFLLWPQQRGAGSRGQPAVSSW